MSVTPRPLSEPGQSWDFKSMVYSEGQLSTQVSRIAQNLPYFTMARYPSTPQALCRPRTGDAHLEPLIQNDSGEHLPATWCANEAAQEKCSFYYCLVSSFKLMSSLENSRKMMKVHCGRTGYCVSL